MKSDKEKNALMRNLNLCRSVRMLVITEQIRLDLTADSAK